MVNLTISAHDSRLSPDSLARIYLGRKDGDLFEYFKNAHDNKSLPLFKSLIDMAQILFRRYGHPYAFEDALSGTYNAPETTIPDGDSW